MLPDRVLNVIHKKIGFPGESSADFQNLSSDVDIMEIKFKKDVTLKMYKTLLTNLRTFLEPLVSEMPFLVHFHLGESLLFDYFTKRYLSRYTIVTPVQLSNCLKELRCIFEDLLKGAATYQKLNEELDLKNMKTANVEKEVTIMTRFEGFEQYKGEKTFKHLKNMMIIGDVIQNAKFLIICCDAFRLTACQKSEAILYLNEIIQEKIETKELNYSSHIISQIQHMLHVEELHCLEFFRLLADIEPLKEFLDDNGFRAGEGQEFHQQLALVTQQLQHEEHDAEILNNLHAIIYLLEPLYNPNLSITQLVKIASDLESSKFSTQLQTVNSNIDLIRVWFSRAEVS